MPNKIILGDVELIEHFAQRIARPKLRARHGLRRPHPRSQRVRGRALNRVDAHRRRKVERPDGRLLRASARGGVRHGMSRPAKGPSFVIRQKESEMRYVPRSRCPLYFVSLSSQGNLCTYALYTTRTVFRHFNHFFNFVLVALPLV